MSYLVIIQDVQLKSGPYFNMSNLFTKIYNMLYYITNLYLQQVLEMIISVHLSTRFTMFLATFRSVLSFFNNFRSSTFYWHLPSKFFKGTLSTVGVSHRFLNNFPK
jgi:hypothetical protein